MCAPWLCMLMGRPMAMRRHVVHICMQRMRPMPLHTAPSMELMRVHMRTRITFFGDPNGGRWERRWDESAGAVHVHVCTKV